MNKTFNGLLENVLRILRWFQPAVPLKYFMHVFFRKDCLYQAPPPLPQDKDGSEEHAPISHFFRNCTLLGMFFLEICFCIISITRKSFLVPALPESIWGTCVWESRSDSKWDRIIEKKSWNSFKYLQQSVP